MREQIAKVVCMATQKTNQYCLFPCKDENKGHCAYCLVMAEELLKNGITIADQPIENREEQPL